jgi:hypothetical protein
MAIPKLIQITPINADSQTLNATDTALVSSNVQENNFNVDTDLIDAYVYNVNNALIRKITTQYSVLDTKISGSEVKSLYIDPIKDLQSNLYTQGIYKADYNFLRPKLDNNEFYIKDISSDRTELVLDSNNLTLAQQQALYADFSIDLNTSPIFNGFYLNLGGNDLLLAVNIGFDNNILIKLYEPLPSIYGIKSNLRVNEKVSDPLAYQVEWVEEEVIFDDRVFLKGPNFNIIENDQTNNSTGYKNNSTIFTSSLTSLNNQLGSVLEENRAELNTDYTDYNNFVFFSSAATRLYNFYYKASLIESYNNQITALNTIPNTTEASSSLAVYQDKINELITKFDGYEYYLYFDSGSKAWPKSNSTQPYSLYSTGSTQVINWYASQSYSASIFDDENQNYIYNIYPSFIVEDADNDSFQSFNEMAAQMFDEIWLYTQAVKNRQDGDNSLEGGISKDLVADALRSYGINLYQSSFADSDLFTSYLGIDQAGNTLPPTGSELITNYVTSSAETTPFDDAQKLIYKRIYHNLPYLLKKKGTIDGLRTLLSCFGVPDTLIRISEFGGKDKDNSNDWDYWYNQFNYKFTTYPGGPLGYVTIPWSQSNAAFGTTYPNTIEFRFQTTGSIPLSQSLFTVSSSVTNLALVLEYTSSQTTSGSYSGSVVDVYNKWAELKFIYDVSGTPISCSTYLPFYDGGWWSVMLTKAGSTYNLVVKNKLYHGYDGATIGFQASSSLTTGSAAAWNTSGSLFLGSKASTTIAGKTYTQFSGSLQEFRYYNVALSQSVFDDYVMNPNSIEGNGLNSSKNQLFYRLPLGGELYTGSNSIHPAATGSVTSTGSFSNTTGSSVTGGEFRYTENIEYIFQDQVPAGIKNRITDKIQIFNTVLPSTGSGLPTTNTLSSYIQVQQSFPISESYTRNVNLVEVAYSPQNEINDDITNQIGFFNIGNYVDIRTTGSSYPQLNTLRDTYFTKYTHNYNYKDYIRIIKYFDNALFKMIKDYVPARTSISTGIVVKQHLLERNKYAEPITSFEQQDYTGSIDMYEITGSDGGVFIDMPVTNSWSGSYITPSGSVSYIQSDEREFYNGELSGSIIDIPQPHPCPVEFNNLYKFVSEQVLSSVLAPKSLWYKVPYDFDYDKTYYLQFTVNNHPSAAGAGAIYGIDNIAANYFFTSSNFAAGASGSYILELKNVVSPLYFVEVDVNILSPASMSLTNFTASQYQLEDTDCAPLDNNADAYRTSQYYMKADYNSGQITPTNFTSLISGSGTRAAVQDYYYNLRRQTQPRYDGSKLTGYQINAFTASTDTSYGKNPVIEKYSDYFVYFDWIGGANPQYPGGGNVHCTYLIGIDGIALPLTTDNINLGKIENIFVKGKTANILPAVYSAGSTPSQVEIVEGGALYDTIMYTTYDGSTILSPGFSVFYSSSFSSRSYVGAFVTQSNITLTDTGSIYVPFLYPLLTGSSSVSGSVRGVKSGNMYFYNKTIGDYVTSSIINYNDTYLPLQIGDIIRFGDTGSSDSSSLDSSFTALGQFQIASISIGTEVNKSSSITLSSINTINNDIFTWNGTDNYAQKYRIIRRIPNESFVLVKNNPSYGDPGFLIPWDFNPDYDVYELARKAGVIQ